MDDEHVTVIEIFIPFYGGTEFLIESIKSVLTQTSPNWRLNVVNDGYREVNIRDIVESFVDSRIKYIEHKRRKGIARNFDFCREMAQSQYFVLLGSDDLLLPNYVEVMSHYVKVFPHAAFFQPGVQVINDQGLPYLPIVDLVKKLIGLLLNGEISPRPMINSLMLGNWLYFPSILWNKSLTRDISFNPNYSIVMDLDFIFHLLILGRTAVSFKETVFLYRRHSGSASAKSTVARSRFTEETRLHASFEQILKETSWRETLLLCRIRLTSRLHSILR